ncbi:DUF4150 domain-containing protein [Oryzifoliimicrobium ureilyticus]|uniref:DUF4150 domain-containing protein n=1 Tax=Oryzifoliimicrobium ureilyticus TaxID=3113724 RepID=UPI003075F066
MSIPTEPRLRDPEYPAPWTTSQPREGLRDIDEAKIVSLSPDICLTPCGSSVVAVPYPIVDYCGHDIGYTKSVRLNKKKAMVLRSRTSHVHGDSPGVRKGIKSGTVEGVCEPVGHSKSVRAEKSYSIRHLDRFWMNDRNAPGEAIYVKSTKTVPAPKEDDPVPGSLRWVGKSDEGRVVSDAAPERLIPGAQYAFLAPQQVPQPTNPAPAPFRPAPAPAPAPAPPNNVVPIRPGVQIGEAAVEAGEAVRTGGALARAMKWGPWIGAAILFLTPTDTAMPWNDEVPQNPHEDWVFREARRRIAEGDDQDKVLEWFRENRRRKPTQEVKQPQEEPIKTPTPAPNPDNVRSKKDKDDKKCLVGPYDAIRDACSARNGYAHHVVQDMTYRLGDRKGKVTTDRIPKAPTEGEGISICLTEDEHSNKEGTNGVHVWLRKLLPTVANPQYPATAPVGRILKVSQTALLNAANDKACAALANSLAEEQVKHKTGTQAPGRIKNAPLPSGETKQVLERGYY